MKNIIEITQAAKTDKITECQCPHIFFCDECIFYDNCESEFKVDL